MDKLIKGKALREKIFSKIKTDNKLNLILTNAYKVMKVLANFQMETTR